MQFREKGCSLTGDTQGDHRLLSKALAMILHMQECEVEVVLVQRQVQQPHWSSHLVRLNIVNFQVNGRPLLRTDWLQSVQLT